MFPKFNNSLSLARPSLGRRYNITLRDGRKISNMEFDSFGYRDEFSISYGKGQVVKIDPKDVVSFEDVED